jgi:hypothetical protein
VSGGGARKTSTKQLHRTCTRNQKRGRQKGERTLLAGRAMAGRLWPAATQGQGGRRRERGVGVVRACVLREARSHVASPGRVAPVQRGWPRQRRF